MLYELGLLFTIAVTGWLALDPLLSAASRGRSTALAAMALAACIWASAELLLQRGGSADEIWLLRRFLYLGACALPVTWLWLAFRAARGFHRSSGSWFIALCALPSAFFYSCLWWAPELYGDWSVVPPRRGPFFVANVGWTWLLISVGIVYFGVAARRLRQASSGAFPALVTAVMVPMVGNLLYLLGFLGAFDPTPILLGVAALLLRVGVIDSGLAAHLPFGRGDLLDQLEAGVLVSDMSGEVVVANPASHRLLREARLVGRPLDVLVDRALCHPDRSIEVRRFPLRTGMGEVGAGVVLTDRTEAEHAARRLQLAARLEAVGYLTAGIADLAEALTKAQPGTELEPELRDRAAEAAEVVAETREGVERIAHLVERLRSFARHDPDDDRGVPVPLVRAVERAVSMARVGFASDVIRVQAESTPPVLAPESQLVQIVLNLLVNAIQASGEDPDIVLAIAPEAGGVSLRVCDRGSGIDEDALPNVFDPFFTTKGPGQGTGLGLSLSYDLARQNGGSLAAHNRKGGGATFVLWLPAAEADVEPQAG
jgi:signal transduction histidine kinase